MSRVAYARRSLIAAPVGDGRAPAPLGQRFAHGLGNGPRVRRGACTGSWPAPDQVAVEAGRGAGPVGGFRLTPPPNAPSLTAQQPVRRLRRRRPRRPLRQALPVAYGTYPYTPGSAPFVFEVDGIRFGTALCIEANFLELFAQYEQMDVDYMLISVMVDDAARAALAPEYATLYNFWVGYSVPAQFGATAPAAITAPGGRCLARFPSESCPGLAIADIDRGAPFRMEDRTLSVVKPCQQSSTDPIGFGPQRAPGLHGFIGRAACLSSNDPLPTARRSGRLDPLMPTRGPGAGGRS